jgi:hypothetical protein
MSPESQRELILTIALASGWIIRAIEEYGVGGPPEFLLASQPLCAHLHQQLNRLGAIPEGPAMTLTQVVRHVLLQRDSEMVAALIPPKYPPPKPKTDTEEPS